ncbi:MAG: HEAT repeat domain-containing protein [Verrucomicrobiales bacterium]
MKTLSPCPRSLAAVRLWIPVSGTLIAMLAAHSLGWWPGPTAPGTSRSPEAESSPAPRGELQAPTEPKRVAGVHAAAVSPASVSPPKSINDACAIIAADPSSEASHEAAYWLSTLGPEAMPSLRAALANAMSLEERRLLAAAVGRMDDADAVQALLEIAVNEPEPANREAVLEGLDALASEESIAFLASALAATSDPTVVEAIGRTVSRGATAEVVDFLAELFAEQPALAPQRLNLVAAMSAIANPEATAALGDVAKRADLADLADAAARSLAKLGTSASLLALHDAHESLDPSMPEQEWLRARLRETVESMRPTTANIPLILMQAAQSPDPDWRAALDPVAQRAAAAAGSGLDSASSLPEVSHYRPVQKTFLQTPWRRSNSH